MCWEGEIVMRAFRRWSRSKSAMSLRQAGPRFVLGSGREGIGRGPHLSSGQTMKESFESSNARGTWRFVSQLFFQKQEMGG